MARRNPRKYSKALVMLKTAEITRSQMPSVWKLTRDEMDDPIDVVAEVDQDGDESGHLKRCLELSPLPCRDHEPLCRRDGAKTGDGQLPPDEHDGEPRGDTPPSARA